MFILIITKPQCLNKHVHTKKVVMLGFFGNGVNDVVVIIYLTELKITGKNVKV